MSQTTVQLRDEPREFVLPPAGTPGRSIAADPRYARCAEKWEMQQISSPLSAAMHPMEPDHFHEDVELERSRIGELETAWMTDPHGTVWSRLAYSHAPSARIRAARAAGAAHVSLADPVAAFVLGSQPPLRLLLVGGRAVVDFADGAWYDIADFETVLEIDTDAGKYDPSANSAQKLPGRQS